MSGLVGLTAGALLVATGIIAVVGVGNPALPILTAVAAAITFVALLIAPNR